MLSPFDENLDDPNEESAEPEKPRSRLFLWLFISTLMGLIFPLLLVNVVLEEEFVNTQTRISQQQLTLQAPVPVNLEREALLRQLNELRTNFSSLNGLYLQLTERHINWSNILSGVGEFKAGQVVLKSILQQGKQLLVQGQAVEETEVMDYIINLEDDDRFDNVSMQTISRGLTSNGETFSEFTITIQIASEVTNE